MKKILITILLVGLLSSCDNKRQLFVDEDGHIHKIDTRSYSSKININDSVTTVWLFTDGKQDGIFIQSLKAEKLENEFDTLADGRVKAVIYKKAKRIE